jgi:hypothetical protein
VSSNCPDRNIQYISAFFLQCCHLLDRRNRQIVEDLITFLRLGSSKECTAVMAGSTALLNGDRATDSPSKQPTSFSCAVCHSRKVRCDRQHPCANCSKAKVECIYRTPPPRRRKRDRETTGTVSQERGKSLKRSTEVGETASATHHQPAGENRRMEAPENGSGRMIMKDGNSIYLDK